MRASGIVATAILSLAMAAPALAQSDDCAELKAVVATAVRIAPGAPLAPDTTLPLLGETCDDIRHGMPTCDWTTDKTGHANADVFYQSLVAKVSACFPGSQAAENQLTERTGPDADVGTTIKLPTGQTIDVNDNRGIGGVLLTVTPAP